MLKIIRVINMSLLFMMLLMTKSAPLSAGYVTMSSSQPDLVFKYADSERWRYLRLGLNYLESPKPVSPPEDVSPGYIHPDSRGFGAYGFTSEAYQDVQRVYPYFRSYSWQDIKHSHRLYELANQAFADWLLRNLQNYIPESAEEEQVFDIIQKAWNTGLSGFRNGKEITLSRAIRAEQFKKIVIKPGGET